VNYDIVNLTNSEGLSNSSINIINQDSIGLLWIGTWDGLNVYNGSEFKIYKPDPGNNRSISNNIIRDIVEEQNNIQWIVTDWGINRLDKRTNTFERFFVDASNPIISNEHSFFIAKNSLNVIFTAVYDQGLFYFNKESHQFVRLKTDRNLRMKKIFFDLDDNLWVYTEDKELYKVVFKKGNFA
jgi:ligand-binding sensor domain-containing protein